MMFDPGMLDSGELLRQMVDRVAADRYVRAGWQDQLGQWRSSLLAVARHLFIPDTIWIENESDGPTLVALHRQRDQQRWLERTYGDLAVIAQVDDGHPGSVWWAPTSSASGPAIITVMLAALDAEDGHRVLEIGTGTGYNAALLAHRLGAQRVTTMEIDPEMAAHARKALSDTGFGAVTVVTGDGELGYPPGAPYDRVISTAECTTIPYSWVAQTRSGGRILTPWANPYFNGGLVALTVGDDDTATGSIVDRASFM
ncbi:MAG: methyltransferase domain-containing protein, partial [Pseudonocardiaceae bacterium]